MSGSEEGCEHGDRAARSYDAEYRSVVRKELENEIRSWLALQFTDADEVLELGCGIGIFSAMIAERVKRLTATDFSPEMLEQAGKRYDPAGGSRRLVPKTAEAPRTAMLWSTA